jgi:hypothetical protein
MEEVELEQLERWMIRKMQRDKKKQQTQTDSNGILITLWCVPVGGNYKFSPFCFWQEKSAEKRVSLGGR